MAKTSDLPSNINAQLLPPKQEVNGSVRSESVCAFMVLVLQSEREEMSLSAKQRKWEKNNTKQTLHPLNGT